MRKWICFALCLLCQLADSGVLRAQDKDYVLVFEENFNGKKGSRPNPELWSCSPRGTSRWNRWIADSRSVAFIRRGKLICRAIRNTEAPADTAVMLTGAVETMNKFSFQYGKIEVRARTKRHQGNFPAIWLMPQPPAESHPAGGEIDIFETVGDHDDVYFTLHTNWTLRLKHIIPRNHFYKVVDNVERWHVYGVEWTADSIVWTVDGEVCGHYDKSTDETALANGQWPFDHPFYIILNQSIAFPGEWAGMPDLDFVYETQFDWVRVWQRR